MTHRHFLVPKNPSPLTLHTQVCNILLYQLHYCINLILNHRKSRTCLIELFKVSLTQHIYTNYQLHNCINLLILITHLNCYELNACIVLAFYIFGYYHYIKQGPTVIGHWSVFKVPSIPLSNLCWSLQLLTTLCCHF